MDMNFTNLIDYPNVTDAEITPVSLKVAAASGAPLLGQYALAWVEENKALMARDPIGSNKLFYGRDEGGHIFAANRIARLLGVGVGIDQIFSVPPGCLVSVDGAGTEIIGGVDVAAIEPDPNFSLAAFQQGIAQELERTFLWLAQEYAGWRFVVCLSGGMDSSIIATYATKHLKAAAAVFSYISDADAKALLGGAAPADFASVSDDFRHASNVANILGLQLLPVFRPSSAVAPTVADAIRLCQDWRDFNVHCASVNLFLAEAIRAKYPGEKVVVLTGDLMNEYVCDYQAEEFNGKYYYQQPRIPFIKRRRFLVRGLDAGDREIGVFSAFGHVLVQPFARLVERYLRVPPHLIERPDGKWLLNGPLLAEEVAAAVGRAKCRAQVGGKDGGTLGIYHNLGLDQESLLSLWGREMGLDHKCPGVQGLIQFGRYRQSQVKNS